jgi:2-polyprenyl-3-methyl-5-hydroxy-6-metoxy-1,4-benzoquinol methylase
MELTQSFQKTCLGNTELLFVVDNDDPTADAYGEVLAFAGVRILRTDSHNMVEALNQAAIAEVAPETWTLHPENFPPPFAVGFMGDDHRPRTVGWDVWYVETLRKMGMGIVYGNDLLQGESLPTQCAMTSDIVETIGYMAPPNLRHMYVDNAWLTIGQALRCIKYLPDVVVEHMHPMAGKAEWTEGHERVNAPERLSADKERFAEWLRGSFRPDVNRLARRQTELRRERASGDPAVLDAHEWRLFEAGTIPEYTKPEWYEGREHTPHLEQGGHRDRLIASASLVAQAAFTIKKATVVDLGCGDGGLLSLLGPAMKVWGYDLMPENVEGAKARNVDVRYGDVVEGDIDWGDIAVCTEMLEHLVDPHAFVRRIFEHCEAIVCSSPWDENGDLHYEYHTWAWDLDGYRALVEGAGFKVIRQRRAHRFQVILGVRP